MSSYIDATNFSTATNSTSSSRRASFSISSAAAASPFQSWLVARNATHFIPRRPLREIEAIFTPITNFYPEHWVCPPYSRELTHKMLDAMLDPSARPAQVATKLRACAQLGKLLWNLTNAEAARLLLGLDEIVGCRVIGAQTAHEYFGNGSCDFYPELRLALGLQGLEREEWAEWWARREAWVRERRGRSNSWDDAVVKVLRGLAQKHGARRDGEGDGDESGDAVMIPVP
ncbi:unnamed protein product [Discula destructiva]